MAGDLACYGNLEGGGDLRGDEWTDEVTVRMLL